MAGITKYGFKRKQYSDIEEELFLSSKEKLGEDINLSEKSFLGVFLRILAWSLSGVWQAIENAYNQMNYRHAEGINLDYIVERSVGIKRFTKAKARGKLLITGQSGKEIYAGFRAKTADGREYRTLSPGVISESGTVKIDAESVVCGTNQNAEPGKIIIVSYPEIGITSVTNEKFAGGREEETDEELRDRFEKARSKRGKSNIDGIEGAILEIPTVESVIVEEVPPHSIRVIVRGGEDSEVAKAILESKAAGIVTVGDTTCEVKDNRNRARTIRFQRTRDVVIHVSVRVSFKGEITEAENVKNNIKQAVLSYIKGLKAGEKVIVSRILATVMEFDEVQDAEVMIGKSASLLSVQNIAISEKEVAKTDAEKVSVTDEL